MVLFGKEGTNGGSEGGNARTNERGEGWEVGRVEGWKGGRKEGGRKEGEREERKSKKARRIYRINYCCHKDALNFLQFLIQHLLKKERTVLVRILSHFTQATRQFYPVMRMVIQNLI